MKNFSVSATARLFVTLLLLSSPAALAQDENVVNGDLFPPQAMAAATQATPELSPEDATHPPVRLTPDKSEIIRLDREARSIIVGNPAHLSVLMDSTKTLILVPQAPGATYFSVLDKSGKTIMQRHVIVASPKEDYVRVRRSCANAPAGTCQGTSVYYCPDMCHQIQISDDSAGQGGGLLGALLGGGSGSPLPNFGDMMGGTGNALGQQLQEQFNNSNNLDSEQ